MKKVIILLLAILGATSVHAQSLHLYDIDTTNFPSMKASFFAFGADGKQIDNFSPSDFELLEDGVSRKVLNVSCPQLNKTEILSSVLTIDVSNSMINGGLVSAISAASAWINGMPAGKSECAITSFSNNSYLEQDFTTDKSRLLQAVNALIANGGTSYDEAFWSSKLSGLEVAKRGKYKRVMVFITDGEPDIEPQTQKIIDLANQNNVTVYCITLNMPLPQCLKDISAKTGGLSFENITTESEAIAIYMKIHYIAQNATPCTIEWESQAQCPKYSVTLDATLKSINATYKSSYAFPQKGVAFLELKPAGMVIWSVPPGLSKDTTIEIKANRADFTVLDIIGNNPNFSVKPKSFNIKANETITVTITYTPTDSLINSCMFEVVNNICNSSFYVRGGFRNQANKNSAFRVTHPNGGEKFGIGTDTVITWAGCDPEDKVKLEYSIDNGSSYKLIAKNATGLKYKWSNIPNTPSNQCLLRATLNLDAQLDSVNIFGLGVLNQVIFNHDGTKLASCGGLGIFVWDVATGDTILSIKENTGFVYCIAFSNDGKRIVSGNFDGSVKIWDAISGENLITLAGHTWYVYGVCFSPDGTKIASASWDKTVKIWDANSGALLNTLTGHNWYVYSLNFSHDGKTLASGGGEKTIKLWDVASGAEIETFTGHNDAVTCVIFSPDDSKIASGSMDNYIKLWDIPTGKLIKSFAGHNDNVNAISFNPDASAIVSGSNDKTIKLWDVASGTETLTIKGHSSFVNSAYFSPDGTRIVSGDYGRNIKLWDAATKLEIKTLKGHSDCVFSVMFNPNGSKIASGNWACFIKILNAKNGDELRTLTDFTAVVNGTCFTPDGNSVAFGCLDNLIRYVDVNTGSVTKILPGHDSYVNCINFHPNGKTMASGSNDKTVKLWDTATGTVIKTFKSHTSIVNSVMFSPDGSTIASGSDDKTVKLWDVASGAVLQTLSGHSEKVNSVSFSPDGSKIASGSSDRTIKIWDVYSGAEILTLAGHNDEVNSVSYSPDGTKIVSGSFDKTIKIWDSKTGALLKTLIGHNDRVNSIFFNEDGSLLASGSMDGTVRVWKMNEPAIIVDISDSQWAIIAPETKTKIIDMGKVLVGSVKDSVVNSFIVNMSDCRSRIDSIAIIGADAGQFFVTSGAPPYTLDAKQSKNVEFRFIPASVGIKTAKVYVYTALETLITDITGEGVLPLLSIENKLIDFGMVNVGEFRDTLTIATIKNIGILPLTISNTKHNKPNDVDFTTRSGGGTFTLAPGEIKTMDLRFTASELGLTNGTLDFEYDGVGSPAKILLIGEGVRDFKKIALTLESGSVESNTGKRVIVPIYLRNGDSLVDAGITSINFELAFNATLLLPIDSLKQSTVVDGIRIMHLSVPAGNYANGILTKLRMVAGLGNATETELKIQNIELIGGNANLDSINGKFTLLGICEEGGARLLNPTGKIAINAIKPNPAESDVEVDLELIENSGYKLILVNSLGQVVKEISRSTSGKGAASEKINVTNLSIGVYNLILQTESERMSRIFIIRK